MENKGCMISIVLYIAVIGVIAVLGYSLSIWRTHNPVRYCDELQEVEYPIACKLRYPILNNDEVKKVIDENRKLQEEVTDLKSKIEGIKDIINEQSHEIWGADIPQIDF